MRTHGGMRWWLSTGAVAAGVGAALLAGAGSADAQTADAVDRKQETTEGAEQPSSKSAGSTGPRTGTVSPRKSVERQAADIRDRNDEAGPVRAARGEIKRPSDNRDDVVKQSATTRSDLGRRQKTSSDSERDLGAGDSGADVVEIEGPPVRHRAATPVSPAPQPATADIAVTRAGMSKLQVAPGVSVDADWYFPDSGTPAGLVFLQHGNLRASGNLRALATAVSQRTNSVVVAPTFQSSQASSPQYYLNGEGTQSGVAALFAGHRVALRASAAAAGYTRTLPTPYVLSGHSAGGNMVTVVGDYRRADPNLKGVLLLDAVNRGGEMAESLAKIPARVPVYQIAAEPVAFNNRDAGTNVLAQARPGRFIGVRIVGGGHLDAEGSTTSFIAAVAAGFPKPGNAAALQVLAAGYITDMYKGLGLTSPGRSGVYPTAGQQVPVGQAKVVRLGRFPVGRPDRSAPSHRAPTAFPGPLGLMPT